MAGNTPPKDEEKGKVTQTDAKASTPSTTPPAPPNANTATPTTPTQGLTAQQQGVQPPGVDPSNPGPIDPALENTISPTTGAESTQQKSANQGFDPGTHDSRLDWIKAQDGTEELGKAPKSAGEVPFGSVLVAVLGTGGNNERVEVVTDKATFLRLRDREDVKWLHVDGMFASRWLGPRSRA